MMLMAVSLNNRDVYEEEFEKACLRQSAEFYRVSYFVLSLSVVVSKVVHFLNVG